MPMSWEKIARRDLYLAGYIAAREYYADNVYLTDTGDIEIGQPAVDQVLKPFIFLSLDQIARFKQGWQQGQADTEQERKENQERELTQLLDACSDGYDPVERTSWKGIL